MSYKLNFSEAALSRLEALGKSDAKKLRQILMKILALRRAPFPQDSKKLESFSHQRLLGTEWIRENTGSSMPLTK